MNHKPQYLLQVQVKSDGKLRAHQMQLSAGEQQGLVGGLETYLVGGLAIKLKHGGWWIGRFQPNIMIPATFLKTRKKTQGLLGGLEDSFYFSDRLGRLWKNHPK